MGKGNVKNCVGVMDAASMSGELTAPQAMLLNLSEASGIEAGELLRMPQVDESQGYGPQLKDWLKSISKSESARARYFPAVNMLNQAEPNWYKDRQSFKRGLEIADILFQDGAAATRYQNTGSGPLVWTSDSSATAWGYYGLSLSDNKIEPNSQVSWAGSRRLNPKELSLDIRNAVNSPDPTFLEALRQAPSKTLAQSASFPDGKVSPEMVSGQDTEWAVRMQNAERLADAAKLNDEDKELLLEAASLLPQWGERPSDSPGAAGQLIRSLKVGKSPDGYPVVEAPGDDDLAGLLADSWRAWVTSEQADRIAEEQRKASGAQDDWAWVERTRQIAFRSRWDTKQGRRLFGRKAQGQIETRYRMLHTLYTGTHRDKMVKKAEAQQQKGPELAI